MSGCYRCGLSDGSESRLCETCFALRWNGGHLVDVSEQMSEPPQGIEWTPRLQRWVLSGGAVLYLGVVSLGIFIQEQHAALRRDSELTQFVQLGGNAYPVVHQQEFVGVVGPSGMLDDRSPQS